MISISRNVKTSNQTVSMSAIMDREFPSSRFRMFPARLISCFSACVLVDNPPKPRFQICLVKIILTRRIGILNTGKNRGGSKDHDILTYKGSDGKDRRRRAAKCKKFCQKQKKAFNDPLVLQCDEYPPGKSSCHILSNPQVTNEPRNSNGSRRRQRRTQSLHPLIPERRRTG